MPDFPFGTAGNNGKNGTTLYIDTNIYRPKNTLRASCQVTHYSVVQPSTRRDAEVVGHIETWFDLQAHLQCNMKIIYASFFITFILFYRTFFAYFSSCTFSGSKICVISSKMVGVLSKFPTKHIALTSLSSSIFEL